MSHAGETQLCAQVAATDPKLVALAGEVLESVESLLAFDLENYLASGVTRAKLARFGTVTNERDVNPCESCRRTPFDDVRVVCPAVWHAVGALDGQRRGPEHELAGFSASVLGQRESADGAGDPDAAEASSPLSKSKETRKCADAAKIAARHHPFAHTALDERDVLGSCRVSLETITDDEGVPWVRRGDWGRKRRPHPTGGGVFGPSTPWTRGTCAGA